MRTATILCVLTLVGSTLHGQECTERFWPFDVTLQGFEPTLRAGDQVSIEYSTDCFRIPSGFWGEDLFQEWTDREDFSSEDLTVSALWFDISRFPADAVEGAVVDDDGEKTEIESFLIELDNGRVRSVATIPTLVGKQTLDLTDTGPVEAGDLLTLNLYLELDGPMANDLLSATLGSQANFFPIEFIVGVPEPDGSGSVFMAVAILIFCQRRRRTIIYN